MNFHTECRNVLLFEFSREMSLDECGLEIMLAIAGVFACEGREGQVEFQLITKAIAITLYRGLQWLTFPVPPSPTSTSLKLGTCEAASAILLTASR